MSTNRTTALELLRQTLGEATVEFRDGQWEAIDALVNRQERLLVVQRTGWGKSSVYFIATRILRDRGRGPTLIVSPLLALMRNQIAAAERLGIRALSINSTNQEAWPELQRAIMRDEADALLISPERLANDGFVKNILLPIAETIGLLVVDEAHCISDWGHDFRPDYRRLINVLQRIPGNVPILCTTATANNRVTADVRAQLGELGIQRGQLTRDTLALQATRIPSQAARLAWLIEHINELPGTGIIYTLTKRDANQVADWLQRHGIQAKAYYGGVRCEGFETSDAYRQHLETQLLQNEVKALVATPALGMGFDKPDLGFVVHYQAPGSVVAYYQQVGRAGRGIEHATGILLSGDEDANIHEYFRGSAFPREAWVTSILNSLEDSDGLGVPELERTANLRRGQIQKVLKFLEVESPSPIIKDGSTWRRTPVSYQMDRQNIVRLTAQRKLEWEEVQTYIGQSGCLMRFLAEALDDGEPSACGKCASCLGAPVINEDFTRDGEAMAQEFLRRSEIELECHKQIPSGAFVELGFHGNLRKDLQAETGRVLSRWRDGGWGRIVAEDKQRGNLRNELVDAAVEMIRARWQPTPFPAWVTCVPSKNHADLVPAFAVRVADTLGIPFLPVVTKVKDNEPQKGQQNSFHQCRNLDGVFSVGATVSDGPVLLIDDIVDSGWTLTVVAAQLRRAGSGPVWPLALTTSSMDA